MVNGWFAAALAEWPAHDRTELVCLIGRLTDELTAQLDAVAPDGVPPRGEL